MSIMDIELNYEEKGTGFPMILLHGNGENLEYFRNQIEYFGRFYRVIAIDTRGHGKSPRGEKPFTITQFAEDLYDFMVLKGIQKAIILGFSDGGNIALNFALKHLDMVEKLILNGANLTPEGVKRYVQIPIEIGYKIASVFAKRSINAKKNAEILGLMVNEPNIKPEELKKINVPTLVIAGSKDMIKTSHTKLIYESLPNARLEILEGDHFIANKRAEEFNKVVHDFLVYNSHVI
ncbi:pimeloyl-ACP methyl ester carboxylesterase [Herbinix hemicellulosilytica]|uniref:AB hydrolase-1 domain-containing protein n=1 Tax=Herbinix hemicellulosilytica TaxID=1564487 RepID=A0A0H5SEY2_HERHM|nr:alpha/beta hydrolase [Herbinix hemicellulosilytica]RBP58985.1 pimeloyl-ACP methyl ester carboxylesterase [Herbinix hemicellulosilytica]CRZ33989.1 hypothetical protein HHT355_0786 [Herbinix hemicellulosilytica]